MKTYLIAYESLFPEDANLVSSIKSFQQWAHPMKNIWLIKTYYDRQEVFNKLRASSAFVTKFLIIQITNDWISYNLSPDVVKWMQGGL